MCTVISRLAHVPVNVALISPMHFLNEPKINSDFTSETVTVEVSLKCYLLTAYVYILRDYCKLQVSRQLVSSVNVIKQINVYTRKSRFCKRIVSIIDRVYD